MMDIMVVVVVGLVAVAEVAGAVEDVVEVVVVVEAAVVVEGVVEGVVVVEATRSSRMASSCCHGCASRSRRADGRERKEILGCLARVRYPRWSLVRTGNVSDPFLCAWDGVSGRL